MLPTNLLTIPPLSSISNFGEFSGTGLGTDNILFLPKPTEWVTSFFYVNGSVHRINMCLLLKPTRCHYTYFCIYSLHVSDHPSPSSGVLLCAVQGRTL
jgi:hypothetical protein